MMNGKQGETKTKRRIGLLFLVLVVFLPLALGCALDGGEDGGNGGDGEQRSYRYENDAAGIARIVDPWGGVWYSSYSGRKLDGYRFGKWKDRHALLPQEKLALFPDFDSDNPRFLNYSGMAYNAANDFPRGGDYPDGLDDAYFVFYDDTVYEYEPGDGGHGGWNDLRMRYVGIVKAVNAFDDESGAVIVQYLEGCFPNWDEDFAGPPPHCYFGIYYHVRDPDAISLANAVALESLYKGEKYYTETATLDEAVAKNTAENEGKFVAAGVVMIQERER